MADKPRGVRLNNPGNIEHGDPWQGLSKTQSDQTFCEFVSPVWGFRAVAVCLMTYQDRYKHNTIRTLISQWAPPTENDTEAYIKAVCGATRRDENEPLDLHDYRDSYPLIRAITTHEQGSFENYFTKDQLDQGCIKAGLENSPRGVVGSAVKATAAVAGVGATYAASDPGALIGAYNTIKPIVDVAPHLLQKGFWVVATIAVGMVLYGEIKKFRTSK